MEQEWTIPANDMGRACSSDKSPIL
jgi:hypothetical protein